MDDFPQTEFSTDILEALSVICHWSTYHGTHCRRTIHQPTKGTQVTLCPLHKELSVDYEKTDEGQLCEVNNEIKIVPRSYKHLKSVMKQLNNEDELIEVITKETVGGLVEEADMSEVDYIKLLSDDARYYYSSSERGQKRAKDLKVVLRKYCPNNAVIRARGGVYCEDCYKILKNVPKVSVIRELKR